MDFYKIFYDTIIYVLFNVFVGFANYDFKNIYPKIVLFNETYSKICHILFCNSDNVGSTQFVITGFCSLRARPNEQ